jgi:hypothetical protein
LDVLLSLACILLFYKTFHSFIKKNLREW